jgi:hypothetical protein
VITSIPELQVVMEKFSRNVFIILKLKPSSWIAMRVTKVKDATVAYVMDSFGDAPIEDIKKALPANVTTRINNKTTDKTNDSNFVALKNIDILANENYVDFGTIPAITAEDIKKLKEHLKISSVAETFIQKDLVYYADTIVAFADKKFSVSFDILSYFKYFKLIFLIVFS